MRRTMLRPLVAAVSLALAASTAPAHADLGSVQIVRVASTGLELPEGATLVGKVTAPQSDASSGDLLDLNTIVAEIARSAPKAPRLPCTAKTAWARSGSALTGWLYTWQDPQTGYSAGNVLWLTDNGDWDPDVGEGIVAFASKDCATSLVMDWSVTDYTSASTATAPECYPIAGAGVEDDVTPGPFTQPVYSIFGIDGVPYFSLDPSLAERPCYRSSSLVVFKAKVSYIEKNKGTKVLIGCYQRSWPVTFAPNVTAGDDPTKPKASWLTVGPASPEETCASGT